VYFGGGYAKRFCCTLKNRWKKFEGPLSSRKTLVATQCYKNKQRITELQRMESIIFAVLPGVEVSK